MVATESKAESHFLSLSSILNYVGLPINQNPGYVSRAGPN